MTQDWLQKTADVPAVIDDFMARYGTEQIESITGGEPYEIAKAALALALNLGLNEIGGTGRKRRRAAPRLFDQLLNALPVIFMLGYDQAKQEHDGAQ